MVEYRSKVWFFFFKTTSFWGTGEEVDWAWRTAQISHYECKCCCEHSVAVGWIDLSAFYSCWLIGLYWACILENSVAMAGKKIEVKLKTSILGTILEKPEMRAEVATALQVNASQQNCITFLKTSGRTPVVRSRNFTSRQPVLLHFQILRETSFRCCENLTLKN